MRTLFVDHVLELHRGKCIVTSLEFSSDEGMFQLHFPANPMAPGSALIECFAQSATILLEVSDGFSRKALPAYIRSAKFHRPVRPGVLLKVEMRVTQESEDGAVLDGAAFQAGEKRASCSLGMAYGPLDDYFPGEHAASYATLYERWLEGAVVTGFKVHPAQVVRRALVL